MKGASDKRSRDKEQSSYREIFKSTSLFGGVQVFNILIAVIRTKFIAVLLGPAGIYAVRTYGSRLLLLLIGLLLLWVIVPFWGAFYLFKRRGVL